MSQWPHKKSQHEVKVLKAEGHSLVATSSALKIVKQLFKSATEDFTKIELANTTIQVKGKGHLSMTELDTIGAQCDNIWKYDKALCEYVKNLVSTSMLPQVPDAMPAV